jgi:hypothetical protein
VDDTLSSSLLQQQQQPAILLTSWQRFFGEGDKRQNDGEFYFFFHERIDSIQTAAKRESGVRRQRKRVLVKERDNRNGPFTWES